MRNNGAGADAEPRPITESADTNAPRQLHPLPRGLVELYGLLAVLFVLVPEWMADGAVVSPQDAVANAPVVVLPNRSGELVVTALPLLIEQDALGLS